MIEGLGLDHNIENRSSNVTLLPDIMFINLSISMRLYAKDPFTRGPFGTRILW